MYPLLNLGHFVLFVIEFSFLMNIYANGIQLTVLDTDVFFICLEMSPIYSNPRIVQVT